MEAKTEYEHGGKPTARDIAQVMFYALDVALWSESSAAKTREQWAALIADLEENMALLEEAVNG